MRPEKPWFGAEGRGFDSRHLHQLDRSTYPSRPRREGYVLSGIWGTACVGDRFARHDRHRLARSSAGRHRRRGRGDFCGPRCALSCVLRPAVLRALVADSQQVMVVATLSEPAPIRMRYEIDPEERRAGDDGVMPAMRWTATVETAVKGEVPRNFYVHESRDDIDRQSGKPLSGGRVLFDVDRADPASARCADRWSRGIRSASWPTKPVPPWPPWPSLPVRSGQTLRRSNRRWGLRCRGSVVARSVRGATGRGRRCSGDRTCRCVGRTPSFGRPGRRHVTGKCPWALRPKRRPTCGNR